MPYQVLGARPGAWAVTVTCTRSAIARSAGPIFAMLSSRACSPSALFAPAFPSARSSAARCFIAARSAALKPLLLVVLVWVDMVLLVWVDMVLLSPSPCGLVVVVLGGLTRPGPCM